VNGTADQDQLLALLERIEHLLRPQPEVPEVTDKQRLALFFGTQEQVEERLVLLSPAKWEWLLAWCTQHPTELDEVRAGRRRGGWWWRTDAPMCALRCLAFLL